MSAVTLTDFSWRWCPLHGPAHHWAACAQAERDDCGYCHAPEWVVCPHTQPCSVCGAPGVFGCSFHAVGSFQPPDPLACPRVLCWEHTCLHPEGDWDVTTMRGRSFGSEYTRCPTHDDPCQEHPGLFFWER